ncbi:heparan sulfate glucosamine 3-o-sulfotransferase 5-like protein [Plakobranchus ocellatus]|uniref:Heparan sulfate glucosamine 3-o-sulfotransferase 5-like protein n=1 Tax=Plakobranchus ocellatus TaxID=259542 RepID=A0AAV3YXB1_9GAST|nr:heparan sulfate glucosamine 3-o-sulfotransferase 5-like protein [Plakobranchus ocellatus]
MVRYEVTIFHRILDILLLVCAWSIVLGIFLTASQHFNIQNNSTQVRVLLRSPQDKADNRSGVNKVSQDARIVRNSKLPNCLIIGFSKCGTLALRGFLSLHTDIVSPQREIRYFNVFYKRGLQWYRNQMPPSSEGQITLEKTPSYIMSAEALKRIYQFNSSIRLIIIVRDPITRLQSLHAHMFQGMPKSSKVPSFREWCGGRARTARVVRVADYAHPVGNVFKLFPRHQVLVLSEESLEQNPLRVMREAERFLGLKSSISKTDFVYNEPKGFYCFNTSSRKYPKIVKSVVLNEKTGCLGSGKGRKHPDIDNSLLKELVDIIRPYNERLFSMIGKRFKWKNFEAM